MFSILNILDAVELDEIELAKLNKPPKATATNATTLSVFMFATGVHIFSHTVF